MLDRKELNDLIEKISDKFDVFMNRSQKEKGFGASFKEARKAGNEMSKLLKVYNKLSVQYVKDLKEARKENNEVGE